MAANPVISPNKASVMTQAAHPDTSCGPARPQRLMIEFYEQPDALVVHQRRAGGPWLFLLLWLIGWTVGCAWMLVNVLHHPSLGTFALALPFWAAWLFVGSLLIWMLFGKETLFLGCGDAFFLRTAIIRLPSRLVPRNEIQGFRECSSNYHENGHYLWGIEMLTLGEPVRFAFRLPDRERAWLIHQLNRFLESSEPHQEQHHRQPPRTRTRGTPFGTATLANRTVLATETLTFQHALGEPPTDCSWQLLEDLDTFAFWQKGRLDLGPFSLLLFFNLVWNSMVLLFVMVLFGFMPNNNPPHGWEWLGLFVFLIPFEVIGLVMFAVFLLVLLEPCRRTDWRFESNRFIRQIRWPLYCHRRAWDVVGLDRLELRRRDANDPRHRRLPEVTMDIADLRLFELTVVDCNNVDLCEIGNLTEGEALWMAHIVFDRCAKWFGK
jgi:hypothetical protein